MKMTEKIKLTLYFLLARPAAILASLLLRRPWLILEKADTARDSGMVFFNWMTRNHPEIPVFYIIRKDAYDRCRLDEAGRIVSYGSFRHIWLGCLASLHIHEYAASGNCFPEELPWFLRKHIRKKPFYLDVFLPHGVTYGSSDTYKKDNLKCHLYICSAAAEQDNLIRNLGYNKKNALLTGLPRLDIWYEKNHPDPGRILYMPTWRMKLADVSDEEFVQSDYYKLVNSILSDPEIIRVLDAYDLNMDFYIHIQMQKYKKLFTPASKRIHVLGLDSSIQELMGRASLLITDCSSVHFDFAYMGKPVLYCRNDRESFAREQYAEQGFSVEENGFGPACQSAKELAGLLEENCRKNFRQEELYKKRMLGFYGLVRDGNCQRLYEVLKKRGV